MNELREIRIGDDRLSLRENLVTTDILPKTVSEIGRDLLIQGEVVIQGAVFARNLEVAEGPLEVHGALFAQGEIHVQSGVRDWLVFHKAVGSTGPVVSLGEGAKLLFGADLNAKSIKLRNAFVAANIFAEEIALENCVVIGGAFATRSLSLVNCVVGTFNAPSVSIGRLLYTLLPSAFSVEPVAALPGSRLMNLSLADLGSLFKGLPQKPGTGQIPIDLEQDRQRAVLVDGDENQHLVNSYSVSGKVLTADLIDLDRLENHFLLSAASLGGQLLKTYDLGRKADGQEAVLGQREIAEFFFDLLHGRVQVQTLDAEFSLDEIKRMYTS